MGCFLTGLSDRTYGVETKLPWDVDFGDGVLRHPTQLYEIGFLLLLIFLRVRLAQSATAKQPRYFIQLGDLFKFYMISYLSFCLLIDFINLLILGNWIFPTDLHCSPCAVAQTTPPI
jgi:prolipoprotein diacylglyceryltransferase